MVRLLGALVAAACVLPSHSLRSATTAKVTPVEKVITLLGQLSKQIQEEGKAEAAEYDKYACFCKAQADSKTNAIQKSDTKITSLQATITALETEIVDLNTDISALGTRITAIEGEITTEEGARKAESDKYVADDANVTTAIQATEQAIEVMKASKGQMSGAKLDLAQVQELLSKMQPSETAAVVALLQMQAAVAGIQPAYKYSSNDIIAVLQNLLVQFKARKKALFDDEHMLKSISEKKVLGLSNEKTFKAKEKVQKEAIVGAKTTDKETAIQDKTDETQSRDADIAFRTELTAQCESKATEWDQRSKARADELTAISEATELLKSGVNPNYGANKKLVGLQQKVAVHAQDRTASSVAPLSFVQQDQRHQGAASSAAAQRVLQLLDSEVARLHSPALAALATKVALRADNFVKVRGLIKDLILKLEAEATSEASQKSFCDTEMAKATASRDSEKLSMEKQEAVRTEKEAKKAQLLQEIATLSQEVADLSKALNEATELRSDEKADNTKTVEDAKVGKKAVEDAIAILKAFYGSFLQKPAADRSGNTISDLAPATSYSGTYSGKTDASKGIFGLLQVILDDFDRTIAAVDGAETAAVTKFGTFKTDTEAAITTKRQEKGNKETQVSTTEGEITAAQDALKDAERLHKMAIEELSGLEAMCVEGEETFAERKAKREQEIAALKEALNILENWQG